MQLQNKLIEDFIKAVEDGKSLADSAANNLSKVVSEVKKSTEVITEIAAASEELAIQAETLTSMLKDLRLKTYV